MSSSPDTDYESDKEECELAFDDHMNYIKTIFDHKSKEGLSY